MENCHNFSNYVYKSCEIIFTYFYYNDKENLANQLYLFLQDNTIDHVWEGISKDIM